MLADPLKGLISEMGASVGLSQPLTPVVSSVFGVTEQIVSAIIWITTLHHPVSES